MMFEKFAANSVYDVQNLLSALGLYTFIAGTCRVMSSVSVRSLLSISRKRHWIELNTENTEIKTQFVRA